MVHVYGHTFWYSGTPQDCNGFTLLPGMLQQDLFSGRKSVATTTYYVAGWYCHSVTTPPISQAKTRCIYLGSTRSTRVRTGVAILRNPAVRAMVPLGTIWYHLVLPWYVRILEYNT